MSVHGKVTEQEYFALDNECCEGVRYEWAKGHVYRLSGESERHAIIRMNIYRLLFPRLDKGERLRGLGHRLFIPNWGYYYPDGAIYGGIEKVHDTRSFEQARVVIEVLSAMTEKRDRGQKKLAYLSAPLCDRVILVSQEEIAAEWYMKDGGRTYFHTIEREEAVFGNVKLKALYEGISREGP